MFKRKTNVFSQASAERAMKFIEFKMRHGVPLLKALESFSNSVEGKDQDACRATIARIQGGADPALAMRETQLISDAGYAVLSSGVPLARAITVVREMSVQTNQIGRSIERAFLSPLLFFLVVSLVTYVFSDGIAEIFDQAAKLAEKTGSTKTFERPVYVENPVFLPLLSAGLIALFFGIRAAIGRLYTTHTAIFYKLAPWRWYADTQTALTVFVALRKAGVSAVQAAAHLATTTKSSVLATALKAGAMSAKKNGTHIASAFITTGSVPKDTKGFFSDAQETGEMLTYFTQAEQYCGERVETFKDSIATILPSIVSAIVYLGVGIIAIDLFTQIMNSFVTPML